MRGSLRVPFITVSIASGTGSIGIARGGNGGGPPRVALFGGGKMEVIPKKKKIERL